MQEQQCFRRIFLLLEREGLRATGVARGALGARAPLGRIKKWAKFTMKVISAPQAEQESDFLEEIGGDLDLSLIHISEPTRPY